MDAWRRRGPCRSVGYFLDDRPVGLMVFSEGADDLYIDSVVAHPLSQGVAVALMERAATLSELAGHRGRLSLTPVEGSERAYTAMGFNAPDAKSDSKRESKSDSDGESEHWILDPAASSRWALQDGQWRFTPDIDKPYVESLRPPLPGA